MKIGNSRFWLFLVLGAYGSLVVRAESFGELEKREYLRPTTAPMVEPGTPIEFRAGNFAAPPSRAVSLDGEWRLTLQDGRSLAAVVPGSIYTDLQRGGITGDPYFGTNDLLAATFSTQTNVYRRTFAFAPQAGARYRLTFEGVTDTAIRRSAPVSRARR